MSYEIKVKNWSEEAVSLIMPRDWISKYKTLSIGEEIVFDTEDEGSFWTPYSQVLYLPEKKVKLIGRKRFKLPQYEFPAVKFLNLGGMDNETIYVDTSMSIDLMRGLPRIVTVPIGSHYSQFTAVTLGFPKIREKVVWSYHGTVSHARTETELQPHWIYEKRSAQEMERLKQMRMDIIKGRLALGEI